MKKLLIFLSVIIISVACMKAQTNVYHKFPTSGAVWREATWNVFNDCWAYQLFISGDTTLGSEVYHKFYKTGATGTYISYCVPGSIFYSDLYIGALREDTLNKKVYFRYSGASVDSLLYDFDLEPGDTLGLMPGYSSTYNVVSGIDSVLIDSSYRKRFGIAAFGLNPYTYLIEGIGCTWGLLSTLGLYEGGSELICFTQEGVTLYPVYGMTCSLITSDVESIKLTPVISIYPNPFSVNCRIMLARTYPAVTISLLDLQGKTVYEQRAVHCSSVLIGRTGIADGIYFLRIEIDGEVVVHHKIMVGSQ